MARDRDRLAESFETENTGGFAAGFLAEEDEFDRRALLRLGSWGAVSVGAVIVALLANQSSIGWRRDQMGSADLALQSQQIRSVAKESQSETRRLASAIDTLNGDRDRLYSRVTVLEQGLDSVTGTIARQNSAVVSPPAAATPAAPSTVTEAPPASQNPAPAVAPVTTTAATAPEKPPAAAAPELSPAAVASVGSQNTPAAAPAMPLMASKSMLGPPDSAAGKLIEPEARAKGVTSAPMPEVVASVSPDDAVEADAKTAVQRTEFAVDVGGANSIAGLRALWRGLLKSRSNAALAALRPIIVVRESTGGLGMQLRLVAGPLSDAGAAVKICAVLLESSQRTCETTVFDGQRLVMKADDAPALVRPAARRRSAPKRVRFEEPAKRPENTTLSSLFSRRGQAQ